MTAVTPSFSHFHPNPSNTKQLLRNPTHFHFFVRFEFLLDFPFKIRKTKFLHHPPNNTSNTNGFFPVLPTFTFATILFTFTVFPLFSPSFEEEKIQSSTGTLLLFHSLSPPAWVRGRDSLHPDSFTKLCILILNSLGPLGIH